MLVRYPYNLPITRHKCIKHFKRWETCKRVHIVFCEEGRKASSEVAARNLCSSVLIADGLNSSSMCIHASQHLCNFPFIGRKKAIFFIQKGLLARFTVFLRRQKHNKHLIEWHKATSLLFLSVLLSPSGFNN